MSEALFAVALYRPHPGREQELRAIVRQHVPALRREELITDFPPFVLQGRDGTLIEMFEWKSVEAKDQAHRSAVVRPLWEKMMEVAEMTSLSTLQEAEQIFPAFSRIIP